jgi:hypothetical protein
MEKNIGVPISLTSYDSHLSLFDKLTNQILFKYWSLKCKNMDYETILTQSVNAIDEILETHRLKTSFYKNINFETVIKTNSGWTFEISKAFYQSEESIILFLFKDERFSQASFTITFRNKNGIILGIKNMFHGWTTDSYFHDLESPLLNPNVLASLLTAKEKIKKGTIRELNVTNERLEIGNKKLTLNNR